MIKQVFCLAMSAGLVLFGAAAASGGLFEDALSLPGRVVGAAVGPGIASAFDPLLDGAASRFRDTVDHAIDRAADRTDAVVAAGIGTFATAMKEEIRYTDEMVKTRLVQLDNIMASRIDQVDAMIDKDLLKAETIALNLLDREATILDAAQVRLEDMVDDSLSRLQDIQRDTFDRIEAAIQDQVPYAASRVARDFEVMFLTLSFATVIVCCNAILTLRMRVLAPDGKPARAGIGQWALSNLAIAVPTLLLLSAVHGYYRYFVAGIDKTRIARVEGAAEDQERVGNFRAALAFRKRAYTLESVPDKRFRVARDEWLADFLQSHRSPDLVVLRLRLGGLEDFDPKLFSEDSELSAASLYVNRQEIPPGDLSAWDKADKELDGYETKKLSAAQSSGKPPVLGKLVFISRIKLILDHEGVPIRGRLADAIAHADAMLSLYPKYTAGLILRAQMRSALQFADDNRPRPAPKAEHDASERAIQADLSFALAIDPDTVRFVRLSTTPLPDNTIADLDALRASKEAEREPKREAAKSSLASYATGLLRLAGPLLGSGPIARAEVERQVVTRIRRDLRGREFLAQIREARYIGDIVHSAPGTPFATLPGTAFATFISMAEVADAGDDWVIAEDWASEAIALAELPSSGIAPQQLESARTIRKVQSTRRLSRQFTLLTARSH